MYKCNGFQTLVMPTPCSFNIPIILFYAQKLQLFQGQMEEIDARLTEAEQVKSNWTPVQDLVIDSLSEQMDELKVTITKALSINRVGKIADVGHK